MAINTILFPTDFSQRSKRALRQAISFVEGSEMALIIYHVYHRPGLDDEKSYSLEDKEKSVDNAFNNLKRACPELAEVNHSFRKELGISTDNIIDMVGKANADLIIMATKGAKGFGELWGSKTSLIVKNVDIPVLVIPDDTRLDNIDRIGLAYDYRLEIDTAILETLVATAERLKANVDVIGINLDERSLDEDKAKARDLLEKQLEKIPHAFSYTHHADVEEGIMQYCHHHNINMISIIPKSYGFLEELFHKSLTQKMVFHSDIPLLVFK